MMTIERYAYSNGFTDKNPVLKMLFGAGVLILSLLLSSMLLHVLIFLGISLLLIAVGKIPWKGYFKLYTIPAGFLFLSVITIAVSIGTEPQQGALALGPLYFTVTEESLATAGVLFFRALACISAAYFISLTLPMNQQVQVYKKLHLPMEFIELTVLMYRFIQIFLDELFTMDQGAELRLGKRNWKTTITSLSLIGSNLFIRVMKSYEEWQNVLIIKGFDGRFYF